MLYDQNHVKALATTFTEGIEIYKIFLFKATTRLKGRTPEGNSAKSQHRERNLVKSRVVVKRSKFAPPSLCLARVVND